MRVSHNKRPLPRPEAHRRRTVRAPIAAFFRRHRRLVIAVGVLVVAASLTLAWLDHQHRYDFKTSEVTFTHRGKRIVGTLASPRTQGPHGLVVFIHGDGPATADANGFYRPIWESFARAGYASLSWDKPGVGRSEGNWLDYSMSERADLAVAALEAVSRRDDIDTARIGLWGGSQAGWVLPKIARRRSDIRFIVAVSPAINWQDQGRFNLRTELDHDDASPAEIDKAVKYDTSLDALCERGATYAEYRALAKTAPNRFDRMSRSRWNFAVENFRADARDDLKALHGLSVLLQVGGRDRNVNTRETVAVYRKLLGDRVKVRRYPDALHSMARAEGLRGLLTAVFAPRSLFVDNFLDDGAAFLRQAHPR